MNEKLRNIIELFLLIVLAVSVMLFFFDLVRFQRISRFSKIVAPISALALLAEELIASKIGKQKKELTSKHLYIAIICGQVVTFIMVAIVLKLQPSEYPVFIGFWLLAILLTPLSVWSILRDNKKEP
jgi:uncharacterized membrane protein YfcA